MEVFSWQGQKDSNPQQRFWRPTCYHYTMPLSNGVILHQRDVMCQGFRSIYYVKFLNLKWGEGRKFTVILFFCEGKARKVRHSRAGVERSIKDAFACVMDTYFTVSL